MIEKLEEHKLDLKHDGSFSLAIGRSAQETQWKNRTFTWSGFLVRLQTATVTPETHAEFMKLSKKEQDQIKDIGGFVGGRLKGGRRKAELVEARQLVTLDADYAPAGMRDDLDLTLGCAYAIYCTHKHTDSKPRLRILIPLDRETSPDEYEAIARKLAEKIGIDYFDDTTYQPNRLMFWPSVPSDVRYVFDYSDEDWLSADSVLAEYPDWRDISYWPESSRTKELRKKKAEKQQDPTEKEGLIGAFCRTYDIREAIETFLPNVYAACASPDRYTYTEGSASGGLVLYDDRFAFSNHATDPAGGQLCNAFDLVRIHRFGDLDEDETGPTNRLPSFKAMQDFVQKDPRTRSTIVSERRESAKADFDRETEEDEDAWTAELEVSKRGEIVNSLNNARLILQKDPALKGIVYNGLAGDIEIKQALPWREDKGFWRDEDDAQLENYLATAYTEFTKVRILSAITKVADDREYHPIKEYLESLPEWDGTQRVDTLLIRYLGAADNPYTRAAIRKTLCAAYRRLYHPGIKFDNMMVLNGGQGIGKSTLIEKLGMEWYSDSLSISDTHDKTAAEKLQGYWILEIGEMAGMRKADIDKVKAFISRQDDKYRASYGRKVQSHPRQCVLIGTTNSEDGYLRDLTGNRRYWNVLVSGISDSKAWDITQADVDQIWAEVREINAKGEPLFLPTSLEAYALAEQKHAMEHDPREAIIREYLDMLLPDDWESMEQYERRNFFQDRDEDDDVLQEGDSVREEVSIAEIWVECLGNRLEGISRKDSMELAAVLSRLDGWEKTGKAKRQKYYGVQKIYRRKV